MRSQRVSLRNDRRAFFGRALAMFGSALSTCPTIATGQQSLNKVHTDIAESMTFAELSMLFKGTAALEALWSMG